MTDQTSKGEGKGKGRWTNKGIQASQQNDIDALKALVAEMAAELDALEAEDGTDEGTEPTA